MWMQECWWTDQLIYYQAQIQGFQLAQPNIPIYEVLEHVKGLILQTQSFRISMTKGNNRYQRKVPVRR